MTPRQIYLDFNASTPIAPEVVDAMRPYLIAHYGNPSSQHWAGAPAKAAVERARAHVAALLGSSPDEIVFTSGGSESNNHALKGVFFANRDRGEHIGPRRKLGIEWRRGVSHVREPVAFGSRPTKFTKRKRLRAISPRGAS